VELLEGCHEFLKECKENGLQIAISAAMELANDLQVDPEFQNVKRVRHVKRHFHYEAHDEPVMTPEKKFEIEFFSRLFHPTLMSKKYPSNFINTQKLGVSCTRLANYQKKKKELIKHCSDLQLALTIGSDADIEGAPRCVEIVCKLSRKAKRESWEQFIRRLERDVTGSQRYGFRVFKNLESEETDRTRVSGITEEQWLAYYEKLLVNGKEITEIETTVMNEFNQISLEELENALDSSGNRKAPCIDNINMELWKYGSQKLKIRMLQLFNDIWNAGRTPEEWKIALVVNIFKKGDKSVKTTEEFHYCQQHMNYIGKS
jgi:hypothetical protein